MTEPDLKKIEEAAKQWRETIEAVESRMVAAGYPKHDVFQAIAIELAMSTAPMVALTLGQENGVIVLAALRARLEDMAKEAEANPAPKNIGDWILRQYANGSGKVEVKS